MNQYCIYMTSQKSYETGILSIPSMPEFVTIDETILFANESMTLLNSSEFSPGKAEELVLEWTKICSNVIPDFAIT